MIKIGINGFGRIGRMAFRAAMERDDVEVVAVNDLLELPHLAYLLKHDSVHGRFRHDVAVKDRFLVVDGRPIRATAVKDPAASAWGDVGRRRRHRVDGHLPDQGEDRGPPARRRQAGDHLGARRRTTRRCSSTA